MPKKHSKKKQASSIEKDELELASVMSIASEDSENSPSISGDVEEIGDIQGVLEEVCTALDSLTEKRPETRIKALEFLLSAFRLHCLYLDETWNYCDTFLSGIEFILRKGRHRDQALSVECLAVFCLQTETLPTAEYFSRFLTPLDVGLRDENAFCDFRSACATALAIFQFITGHCDFVSPKDLMKSFETVFKGSCLKGDGKAPVLDVSVSCLHISALRSWGLLYTILTPDDADTLGKALLPTLLKLLQASNVDMRIMAGEIAALIYERIRTESDERYKGPHYNSLVTLLNDLATDGTKSRSKVDRKKQRYYFRDFVDTVSKTDSTETSVTIGPETLVLSSCVEHFHYEFLCYLLKGGVSRHLRQNSLVRDLFNMGEPILISESHQDRRLAKGQKRLELSFASKLRTQKLNSFRDKRRTIASESDHI